MHTNQATGSKGSLQSDLMSSLPLSPQYRTATSFLQTLCSDLYARQATSSGEAQSLCRHTVAFKASLEICVGRLWNIKTILYSFLLSQQQTPSKLFYHFAAQFILGCRINFLTTGKETQMHKLHHMCKGKQIEKICMPFQEDSSFPEC